jgi:ABC-type polysaccharide/polyol phosphate export permease
MSDAIRSTELVEINPPVPFLDGPRQMVRSVRDHIHMVSNLIQRDVRLRYRDSAFGYFWSLLEPLMLTGVYYILFVIIAGRPEPGYPLLIILGVITWQLFAKGLSDSLTCLTRNEGMIKQVYFPRELFAITTVGSKLVLAAMNLLVVVPLMIYFAIPPSPYLLMVPVGLLLAGTLALGIGLGAACLVVVNRDVEFLFRFLIRAGIFVSPILWTVDMAPSSKVAWLQLLLLNPLAVPITMVRNGVAGKALGISDGYVIYSVAFCVLSLLIGSMVFKKFEGTVVKKL